MPGVAGFQHILDRRRGAHNAMMMLKSVHGVRVMPFDELCRTTTMSQQYVKAAIRSEHPKLEESNVAVIPNDAIRHAISAFLHHEGELQRELPPTNARGAIVVDDDTGHKFALWIATIVPKSGRAKLHVIHHELNKLERKRDLTGKSLAPL